MRKAIGLSGQYAAIDENLTGRENLWMFGRLYHLSSAEARTRADELLERFLLDEAADRVAKTYSGGMRRRLDLAAALIGRPRLLFLDEPTTGLDPRSRLGMWDVIRAQVREGATLLLTTQYLEEADELANEIAVVDKGKIIARGTADQLKSQVGGERIEVVAHEPAELARAAQLLAPDGTATVEEHIAPDHDRGATAARPTSSTSFGGSAMPGSRSTTSPCAGRRSTTSSSSSPATAPRSCRDEDEEQAA